MLAGCQGTKTENIRWGHRSSISMSDQVDTRVAGGGGGDVNSELVNMKSDAEIEDQESKVTEEPTQPDPPLSKNKLRKLRKHEKLLQNRALKRQKEREVRKQKNLKKSLGNDEKLLLAEKLKTAMNSESTPKVVIDCQYDKEMTYKEKTRLAQQLRRAYSSNKSCSQPLHLIFTNLSKSSEFFGICCKQNDGFANYIVDMREDKVIDVFPVEEIVYLSPDSSNVLKEFEQDKVYVIGGLVDETTNKDISLKFSENHKISSARLPIDEHFLPQKDKGTLKKVLTVNQVFDIILEWHRSKDWIKAISVGLPERTGFVPIDQTDEKQEISVIN